MKTISRRDFLKQGGAGLGGLCAVSALPRIAKAAEDDAHFFVQIYSPGGLDPTYTFDARPLEMARDNLQHNVLTEEPIPLVGKNGGRALRTNLIKPLEPFLGDFSIINGIHMSGFDSHEQNISYLMSASAFGGDAFLPALNKGNNPLDFVRLGEGNFLTQLSNDQKAAHLSARATLNLGNSIAEIGKIDSSKRPLDYINQRVREISGLGGGLGAATSLMSPGIAGMPRAASAFSNFSRLARAVPENEDREILLATHMMTSLFRSKLTNASIFVFKTDLVEDLELDVHDGDKAKKLPETIDWVYRKVALLLQTFKNTPYDRTRSMYDVTTFMICSEMGRTVGHRGPEIHSKGTDHNPFVNTVLLGGKNIKKGLVIGASDLATSAEVKEKKISAAHLSRDEEFKQVFGLPFDFKTFEPNPRLMPKDYRDADYLRMPSVANTVLAAFGVKEEQMLKAERNGPAAPVLKVLL